MLESVGLIHVFQKKNLNKFVRKKTNKTAQQLILYTKLSLLYDWQTNKSVISESITLAPKARVKKISNVSTTRLMSFLIATTLDISNSKNNYNKVSHRPFYL